MSKELDYIFLLLENLDIIRCFDAEALKEGFVAAMQYAETSVMPEGLSKLGETAFYIFKPGVDKARWFSKTRSERGKKGAEARWHTTDVSKPKKPEIKPTEPQKEPQKEAKSKKFVKPTLEEVKAYCNERGNNVDPEAFWSFYESKGWMVGKNPMKQWKMAVITWEKGDRNYNRGSKSIKEDLTNDTSNYGNDDDLWN